MSSSSTAPSSSSKKVESSSSTAKSSSSVAKSSSSSKNEKSSSSSNSVKSSSSNKASIASLDLARQLKAVYRNGELSVTLPRTSEVRVDVFDMMGNLTTSSRGYAAEHVVSLQHLNRGFYVVRVSANSVTRVLKVQVK